MPASSIRAAASPDAAVARTELTFTTWNVHGCRADGAFDPAAVAEVLACTGADVIALQEVATMEGGVDQAAAIAALLGMQAVFGPNLVGHGGRWRYGNALLSRLPIAQSANHDLSVGGAEPRGCLTARLQMPADGELLAASAHFGLRHGERARQAQLLARFLDAPDQTPVLLGADANDWFPGRDTRRLRASFCDAWRSAGSGSRATYPAALPLLRLDHVYVREPSVEVRGCETATSALIRATSDHLPVVARLGVAYYRSCARPLSRSWASS